MEYRKLGNTGISVSQLGFGASSLGSEFRQIQFNEAIESVHVALDSGMNIIDTSPYYGRGMAESLLGQALRSVPRDSYYMCTKLGRYSPQHFDFSTKRVEESVHVSLERMKLDYLDIVLCHDVEFVDLDQIINETIPAMNRLREAGKVKWIGISGYPMKVFREIIDKSDIDVILSYNHYTLQNTMLERILDVCDSHNVAVMNAAPFCARLLTSAPLPDWHKATPEVRAICKKAAELCSNAGSDIAKLALQYSLNNERIPTCITGSANPKRIAQWVSWANEPMDHSLLNDVLDLLKPIHNWFYIEGRPENNDVPNQSLPRPHAAYSQKMNGVAKVATSTK